jgi:hypothetical protein
VASGGSQVNKGSASDDPIAGALFADGKADGFAGGFRRRQHQGPDLFIQIDERLIVREQGLLDLGQPFGQRGRGGELFADADKDPNHKNAHFNGLFAFEDGRGHDRAMLGEGVGAIATPTPVFL